MLAILSGTKVDLQKMRNATPETEPFIVNENENINFVDKFFYFGIMIDLLIDDTNDIKTRTHKVKKDSGTLNLI